MADAGDHNPELIHTFKNHLAIIIGFSDLLLSDIPQDDPRHKDVLEIQKAAHAALALLPSITKRG